MILRLLLKFRLKVLNVETLKQVLGEAGSQRLGDVALGDGAP